MIKIAGCHRIMRQSRGSPPAPNSKKVREAEQAKRAWERAQANAEVTSGKSRGLRALESKMADLTWDLARATAAAVQGKGQRAMDQDELVQLRSQASRRSVQTRMMQARIAADLQAETIADLESQIRQMKRQGQGNSSLEQIVPEEGFYAPGFQAADVYGTPSQVPEPERTNSKQTPVRAAEFWRLGGIPGSNSNSNSNAQTVQSARSLAPGQMQRPSRTRLKGLVRDLVQGTLEEALVEHTYNKGRRGFESMKVRGVTLRVTRFSTGDGAYPVGIMNTNTTARERYGTADQAILIKPSVGEREATGTLIGSILNLVIPHFMHCYDIFRDGKPTVRFGSRVRELEQRMVIVIQNIPYTLASYLEQLSHLGERTMFAASVSIAQQCLMSLYAFAAFSNQHLIDRHGSNGMVGRTTSPTIDYTHCDLFAPHGHACPISFPALPKVPGSAFFGRLVMIDFGQMEGPISSESHAQSNIETILKNRTGSPMKFVNHFDERPELAMGVIEVFKQSAIFFLHQFPSGVPGAVEVRDVFERAQEENNTLADHRAHVLDVLQKLTDLIPV